MNIRQSAVLAVLMCSTSVAISGNVYKCKGEDGSIVYSGIPCAADAEKVRVQSQKTSSSGMTGLRPGELEALSDIRQKELDEEIRKAEKEAYAKTQKNLHQPSRQTSKAYRPSSRRHLIDPYTGNVMPRTGAGYTDPGTGTYYHETGGGVVNTRTGEFTPTH
jgi:hypothetical protein